MSQQGVKPLLRSRCRLLRFMRKEQSGLQMSAIPGEEMRGAGICRRVLRALEILRTPEIMKVLRIPGASKKEES